MSDTDVLDIRAKEQPGVASVPAVAVVEKRTLRLTDIVGAASRLGKLLAEESRYLDIMDFKAVAGLQNEKMKLVSALEIQKKILKLDPTIKAGFSREDITAFETIAAEFDKTLASNYEKLRRVKIANQKIVDIFARALSKRSAAPAAYGKNGTVLQQPLCDLPFTLSQNV